MDSCPLFCEGSNCCFSPGKKGNPVMVILESPGNAEVELNRPAAGRTGANLCRLFKDMQENCCLNSKSHFCIRKVSLLNAKTKHGHVIKLNDRMLEMMTRKHYVLCFGREAVKRFRIIYKKHKIDFLRAAAIVFCFPHIGTRGLSVLHDANKLNLTQQFKTGNENEPRDDRESRILRSIARFIESKLKTDKHCCYAVQDFLEDQGLIWRPNSNPDSNPGEWTSRKYLNPVNKIQSNRTDTNK